ncbi:MAG TPA: hypothetical protein VLL95_02570, partial [Phnomibacter sp.]|nr:hypothetical protein [Phnomibacter sp.]
PPFEAPTTKDELFMQMRKGAEEGKSLHVVEMGGKSLVKHYQYMRTLPVVGEILDSIIEAGHPLPTFQIMHQAYFSKGFLLFITYEPVPAVHETFKRFANVFDQIYTRFLDLQRAEAQAREAQVEAALERVRSRSMAMHKSEELADLSLELVKQVQALGVATWFCAFNIYDDDANSSIEWGSNGQGVFSKYRTPRDGVFLQYYKAGKRGETLHVHEIPEDKCAAHYEYLCSLPGVGDQLLQMKAAGIPFPKYQIDHVAFFKQGYLLFITYEPVPEAHDIFKRFARVFEQSFTRFLDLKNAEAQAREAEIQLALERVRARSLAMHHTDELQEVVNVVAQQLLQMGIDMDGGIFIAINDEVNYDLPFWAAAGATDYVQKVTIPFFNQPIYTQLCNAIKKRDSFITEYYTKAEKNEFLKHMFRHHPWNQNSAERKAELLAREGGYARSVAVNQHTTIGITNHHGKKFSDADNAILRRFGSVLEQSYTRFLDLQKAEEQAREAKIEAALERVRSRSLAMHHSSELSAVVDTLLSEFTNLEFALTFCIINLIDEQDRSNTVWAANPETGKAPESYYMKFEDYPFHHAMWDAWKAQKKHFIYTIEGKEKKIYDEYLYTKTEFRRFPKHVQEANKALKRYVAGFTFFKYSGLQTVSENHISNEDLNILERFGRVFEQCYTRFLDLQKAEAQAREAQIEASLEKVRSRSMAMQQPEELVEVAELLRKEMGQLGVEELETSSIYIVEKETKQAECWYAIKDVREEDTRLVSDEMTLLLTDTWVGKQMWKFYQSCEDRTSILMKGERRREWINYCAQHSRVLQGYYGDEIPDRTYHLVKFNGGYIGAAAPGDISAESWDLLKRVSTVFSLAYTRFKDLQDAAARAREAQIELALERVRSRSMAMHKSEELKEVIRLVLDQFIHLNINAEHAGFYIDYKVHDDMHIWLADPNIEPYFAVLPYFDTPTWNSFLESKAKGIAFHTDLLDFKEKNKFYKSLFKLFEIPEEAKRFYLKCKGLAVSTVLLDNVGLYIENFQGIPYSEEENKILMRFGKVFQQTYTRFLDLQKAEAQAREAEIQLALERVRARAMAMQKSDELAEAATILFQQVKALGIETYTSGFTIWDNDEKDLVSWMCNADGSVNPPFRMPALQNEWHRQQYESWKRGDEFIVHDFAGEEMQEHYAYLRSFPLLDEAFKKSEAAGVPTPKRQVHHAFNFTQGNLLFITLQPVPEAYPIFKRFAATFEQTYTRFLDLQKAEAQAWEAQVEAALERVRAKAMAMHTSQELSDVVHELRMQMGRLGQKDLDTCVIHLHDESPDFISAWAAMKTPESEEGILEASAQVPKRGLLIIEEALQAYAANKGEYVIVNEGEKISQWMTFLQQVSPAAFEKLQESIDHLPQKEVRSYWSFADFSGGALLIVTTDPPIEETRQLLRRFSNVFGLAYRRFSDIKHAEAQAREAQIEAALERVRSRTMGMQKSTELNEVAFVLFKQIRLLGGKLWGTGFALCNAEDGHDEFWFANEMGVMPPVSIPNTEDDVHVAMLQCWKEHKDYLSSQKEGEALAAHYRYLYSLPQMKAFFDPMLEAGFEFPNWQQWHAAYFSKGYLLIITTEPYAEPDIFIRFAKVFDQTYTRFLDLQKAEAQARESQIQLSLERV